MRLAAAVLITVQLGCAVVFVRGTHRPAETLDIGGRQVRLIDAAAPLNGPLLDRVAAGMGQAVSAVERFWDGGWPGEVVVVATGSARQFAAEADLDPAADWHDIAAVAVADDLDLAMRRAFGQRIVLAPGAGEMSDAALEVVLTHELFHLAARSDTAPDAPRWLTEGVADFVARPAAPVPASAADDGALPADVDLDRPGRQRSAGYDRAWWFARFVAARYGTDGLLRLYREACGPAHPDFPAAVTRALGVDVGTLRAEWVRWLARSG